MTPHPGVQPTPERLLRANGVYHLEEVARVLSLDPELVKRTALGMQERGLFPWSVMGVRRLLDKWLVRMKVFRGFYLRHWRPDHMQLPPECEQHPAFQAEGTFLLDNVCHYLPYSNYELRHLALENTRVGHQMGIWKDGERWYVDMKRFNRWLRLAWLSAREREPA